MRVYITDNATGDTIVETVQDTYFTLPRSHIIALTLADGSADLRDYVVERKGNIYVDPESTFIDGHFYPVSKRQLYVWLREGELIQYVMPHLSPAYRDQLIVLRDSYDWSQVFDHQP